MRTYLFLLLLMFTPLRSLEQLDGGLSLRQEERPLPRIFGISFGEDLFTVSQEMTKLGLSVANQKMLDKEGQTLVLMFSGTPRNIPVKDGLSKLLFFEGKLIRMDFVLPPTYENFLVVRNQLFYSMGDRFQLDFKQEVMEDLLRSTLANMSGDDRNRKSNELVNQSMVKGSTFFYYKLRDNNQELNVTYSFHASKNKNGQPKPELRLHYSLADALAGYKSHFKRSRKMPSKILPSGQRSE